MTKSQREMFLIFFLKAPSPCFEPRLIVSLLKVARIKGIANNSNLPFYLGRLLTCFVWWLVFSYQNFKWEKWTLALDKRAPPVQFLASALSGFPKLGMVPTERVRILCGVLQGRTTSTWTVRLWVTMKRWVLWQGQWGEPLLAVIAWSCQKVLCAYGLLQPQVEWLPPLFYLQSLPVCQGYLLRPSWRWQEVVGEIADAIGDNGGRGSKAPPLLQTSYDRQPIARSNKDYATSRDVLRRQRMAL